VANNPLFFFDPDGKGEFGIHVGIGGTKSIIGGSVSVGIVVDTDKLLNGNYKDAVFVRITERVGLKMGVGASGKVGVSYSEGSPKEGVQINTVREATVATPEGGGTISESVEQGDPTESTKSISYATGVEVSGGVLVESTQTIKVTTILDKVKNFFTDLLKGDTDEK
jgi:hypothetical protein